MLLKIFLCILIYFTSSQEAKDVQIPLCALWNSTGTIVAGSTNGTSGSNATLLNEPTAVVVGKNDTMYVVDSGNNRLMKYEHGSNIGQQVNISTYSSNGNLSNPQDVAVDESGAIYISDAGNDRIVKWTFDPPNVKVLANISSPSGIYLHEQTNYLYVVEGGGPSAVVRINLKSLKDEQVAGGGNPQPGPPTLSSLYGPIGIHVDKDRNIFVAESISHRITKWVPKQGSGKRVAGTGNVSTKLTELSGPTSIIVSDTGTMYITDMNNNRILRWTSNANEGECFLGCVDPGINTTVINPLNRPYDTTFDSKFNFLVVERNMHRVQRFDLHLELPCMLKYCRPPIISIQDHQSDNIRSQSMTFFISAKLDCHRWLTTNMKCTVIACFPGDLLCIPTAKLNTIVNTFLVPDSFNMIIPPFGLPVGTYNFTCTITMTSTGLNSSISTTLQIIRSPILITLLPSGKSQITLGYQQQYTFYPNVSSNNNDDSYRQSMRFVYYCRKYSNLDYTMINGIRLSINEDSKNPKQSTCFNLKVLPQSFVYDDNTIRSSLTIMNGSLQINQTYEFYVEMYNHQGLVDKSDAVLIQIQSKNALVVEISTVFDTLTLDEDYQLLNPSTQILLQSSCQNSSADTTIEWEIYQGTMNNYSVIEWEEYNHIKQYINQWFYGINSSMFTATNRLFSSNKNVSYWQFVAIYTDGDKEGSGLVQLKTNYPPLKQFCSINPINGHTSQLYTVICQNWTDLDGIKDYFLHVVSSKSDIQMSIAHSTKPMINVYLPNGDPKSDYNLSLIVHVKDKLGAWTESDVITIKVKPDQAIVNEILNFTENYHDLMDNLLLNGDRNQLTHSFSTILNQMALYDQESLMNNSQVRISELIISTFETIRAESSITNEINASVLFIKNLNHRSNIRAYFLNFYQNNSLRTTTIEEIIILSSTINQLTDTTSEWTQTSLSIASKICNQLANILYDLSRQITFEQTTLVINSVAQCTSNVFTGVNAPLQGRGFIFDHGLNKDFTPLSESESESESESDYDEYADYELLKIGIPNCNYTRLKRNQVCKEIHHEDDNSSTEFLHNNLDLYNQKLLATELHFEIEGTIFFLAKSIRRHLNIFQEFPVIYPVLRMLVEQIYQENIEEKLIDLFTRNASIQFPKNLTFHSSHQLGVRTTLLPLAPADGYASVSLSTALTLSILDNQDKELQINTTNDFPIEMFIPRDINLPIPSFFEKNMTKIIPPKQGTFEINRQFFISYINITQNNPNLTISIHLDLKPSNNETSYAIIYKFDHVPAYNSTDISIDGSTMFCRQDLVENMDYYTYYVDNIKTAGHKSLFLGIRELEEQDECLGDSLPKITDQPYRFFGNYSIRIYSSGCYYLDDKGRWKSDGMKVGPKTNFEYTHCYSNHN